MGSQFVGAGLSKITLAGASDYFNGSIYQNVFSKTQNKKSQNDFLNKKREQFIFKVLTHSISAPLFKRAIIESFYVLNLIFIAVISKVGNQKDNDFLFKFFFLKKNIK